MPNDSRPIKEELVKKHVKRMLKRHNCYCFMPVQSGYGAATLDIIGCHKGRFFSIETKAPGKSPSPRQELIMDMMNAAGAAVFVIGEEYMPGDHVGYADGTTSLKHTFSGMAALEAWLLLGR